MYCPDIFKDEIEVKQRIITYLSAAHRYKFMDLGVATRIVCPDLFTTYHYCFENRILRHLTNKEGKRIYNTAPYKTEGFMEAICGYILPVHSPHVIYNVCKIPFLQYESKLKEN